MKNRKSVIWGILLILFAAYVVVNKLGVFVDIPVVSILLSVVFIYFIINWLIKRNFFEVFFPAALIGCMFDEEIASFTGTEFDKLTPWTLLFVAVLLSIGFDMIFKKNNYIRIGHDEFHGNFTEETSEDGFVKIDSAFDGATRYVNSPCFERAQIHNTFGKNVVYFNNAIMKNGNATINVENSFGQTVLYIPKTWRADVIRDCSFGDVKIFGSGNADMDAPYVKIKAEVAFGDIEIYFV